MKENKINELIKTLQENEQTGALPYSLFKLLMSQAREIQISN